MVHLSGAASIVISELISTESLRKAPASGGRFLFWRSSPKSINLATEVLLVSRDCTQIDRCSPSISEEWAKVLFTPSFVDDHQNAVGRGDLPGRLDAARAPPRIRPATPQGAFSSQGEVKEPTDRQAPETAGRLRRRPAVSSRILRRLSGRAQVLHAFHGGLGGCLAKSFTCSLRTWICDWTNSACIRMSSWMSLAWRIFGRIRTPRARCARQSWSPSC